MEKAEGTKRGSIKDQSQEKQSHQRGQGWNQNQNMGQERFPNPNVEAKQSLGG